MHFCFRVLLASIRDIGGRPCPRCLIPLKATDQLGQNADDRIRIEGKRVDDERRKKLIRRARRYIYEGGRVVKSAKVELLLKEMSLVPTEVCPTFWVSYRLNTSEL